jgi:hypothetical protein
LEYGTSYLLAAWLIGRTYRLYHGLTRVKSTAQRSYANRYFSGARKSPLQEGSWPSYYPYRNETRNDSDKGFWELAGRVKDLKELKILREMQENLVAIMQQNSKIIALLGSFFNARRV